MKDRLLICSSRHTAKIEHYRWMVDTLLTVDGGHTANGGRWAHTANGGWWAHR
jgi:hypothetical protein